MWLAIGVAVVCYIVWNVLFGKKHCLDSWPGPPTRPILGNVLIFLTKSALELFKWKRSTAKHYKDRHVIKVFNRRILELYNPDDIEVLLTHSKNITKDKPYVLLEPWLGTGLVTSTGAKWHKRRKLLTPTFHFDILRNFLQVFEEKSQDLVKELRATNGNEVDVYPMAMNSMLQILLETAMGTRLDVDKSTDATNYIKSICEIGDLILQRLNRPWLYIDFFFKRSALGKQFYQSLDIMNKFVDNVITERRKMRNWKKSEGNDVGSKKRMAFLDLLFEVEERGEIDTQGIREEVDTFMFAGHETTGTALTFILMVLADREDLQDQICEEYRFVMGNTTQPTISNFSEMKHLDAIIKETMRVFTSPPRISRQITEDLVLGNKLVKAGSQVAVSIYDLHHREDLFPDPEEFRPERFLHGEVTHPYAFIPFSAGLRNCIGQRFAMLELKTVITQICLNFKMRPRFKNWRVPVVSDLLLRPTEPVFISFTPREGT